MTPTLREREWLPSIPVARVGLLLLAAFVGWASPSFGQELWSSEVGDSELMESSISAELQPEEDLSPSTLSIPNAAEPTPVWQHPGATSISDMTGGAAQDNYSGSPVLSQGVQFDENISGQIYGSPDPTNPGLGGRLFGNFQTGPLRALSAGVYGNDNQTVYNGGGTLVLFQTNRWLLGTRGLFGVVDNQALNKTEFAYTFDGWLGTHFQAFGGGEHYIKVGGFVDQQETFGKAGPEVAALLFANEPFPVTVDAAVGFGYGDDVDRLNENSTIVDVADRDYQLRTGVFLSPKVQVGLTGMIADWEGGDNTRSWGVGAFSNLYIRSTLVRLDFTSGDEGFRGYANVSYLFGGGRSMLFNDCTNCRTECCVDGQAWLAQAVNRDVALQTRVQRVELIDRVIVGARLVVPPITAPPPLNGNGNAIVEPGDGFELDVFITNPTSATVSTFTYNNVTLSGTAPATEFGISFGTINNIGPGQTAFVGPVNDINVLVDNSAANGQTVFASFDISVNGTTRRVTVGPIVVGSSSNGQSFIATQ